MEEVGHRFKISNVEGKGVGWITTKNIQRGEKIWTESPILNSIGQFALLGTINKAVNGIVKLNKLALNVPGTASFQQCQVTLHLINKGQKKGIGAIWPKTHKMVLISEYLAADSSPDASVDALAIINIGKSCPD